MERDLTKTAAYDYNLPKELIAQDPAEPRDSSRLMIVHKKDGSTEDRIFRDITEYLNPGDLLVLNDTRVLPARVEGVKKSGEHGAHVEIFFLNPGGAPNEWTALVRPGRKLPEGTKVALDADTEVTVGARLEDGLRTLIFAKDADPLAIIHKFGKTPLPHYITDTHAEPERYQTVYAKAEKENSVAAPTAGLHFTPELLQKLEDKGVPHVFVTLRVGLGTFRPVKVENIADHIMHEEFCEIPPETAEAINAAKARSGRVVAVGTTVVRTLESFAQRYGKIVPGALDTRLFISPGFEFRVIDALITNFHLPMSTLLMLVSAFGGYDTMMSAYNEAVRKRYRFFSFGDSMFIE
ncbi:tRNA preQ1(34) S-adenosylmethionine ribosyltransferase-isomerase QueA [uncultured Cloacibacillus sp.]|uniref:tRNA preQ1(34) S-adenosylmethionine ribosyltransferase-isomerase QueA n=1 Tax=uncultured Cloacibacillus sp. TaxID=889794 RepID=UPI0025D6A7B2|nr:tRNA preQ1(34) S-adenosylmethionine ribosyltransferase-isomerase QueA [uncultured Cloacibacillus sp.]